jgi:hypothetical protein
MTFGATIDIDILSKHIQDNDLTTAFREEEIKNLRKFNFL